MLCNVLCPFPSPSHARPTCSHLVSHLSLHCPSVTAPAPRTSSRVAPTSLNIPNLYQHPTFSIHNPPQPSQSFPVQICSFSLVPFSRIFPRNALIGFLVYTPYPRPIPIQKKKRNKVFLHITTYTYPYSVCLSCLSSCCCLLLDFPVE